jgi:hypothetical protein
MVLGIWLFISAFVWPHTPAQRADTWIVGVVFVIFSALAMSDDRLRFVNTLASVWLFIYTLAAPHVTSATLWNNLIVAAVVFALSLVPGKAPTGGPRREVATPVSP